MKMLDLTVVAGVSLAALTLAPTGAYACEAHWYAFAGAYSSQNTALHKAGQIGEAQVQYIGDTNSPNANKNLWLVYRGWFDSKSEANGELPYFRQLGFHDAYVKKLCMW